MFHEVYNIQKIVLLSIKLSGILKCNLFVKIFQFSPLQQLVIKKNNATNV